MLLHCAYTPTPPAPAMLKAHGQAEKNVFGKAQAEESKAGRQLQQPHKCVLLQIR